jgi:hypothetical protein
MNATETRERPDTAPVDDVPPLVHLYVGQRAAHPDGRGSVALCGHVKKNRWTEDGLHGFPVTCVVCAAMTGGSA